MSFPDSFVLELLRCPVTHSSLSVLDAQQLASVNKKVSDGKANDRNGRPVTTELKSGLINAEKSFAYSIRGGIMQLIADEAIVLGD